MQVDVGVVRRDGQWRIARLPAGVLVRLSDLRANYRTVKTWFVDPVRGVAVPDLRYLPGSRRAPRPPRDGAAAWPGRRPPWRGAAMSMLPPGAQLRSNVAVSPEGALIVDLTEVGDLDDTGRRLAAQVVLSLGEVSVGRVRLLVDGAPLLADRPDLTRDDIAALVAEPAPVVSRRWLRRLRRAGCTRSPGQPDRRCPAPSATAAWPAVRGVEPAGGRIAVVAARRVAAAADDGGPAGR